MVGYGLATASDTAMYKRSLDINVNLVLGPGAAGLWRGDDVLRPAQLQEAVPAGQEIGPMRGTDTGFVPGIGHMGSSRKTWIVLWVGKESSRNFLSCP